jgi:hypothetical protein
VATDVSAVEPRGADAEEQLPFLELGERRVDERGRVPGALAFRGGRLAQNERLRRRRHYAAQRRWRMRGRRECAARRVCNRHPSRFHTPTACLSRTDLACAPEDVPTYTTRMDDDGDYKYLEEELQEAFSRMFTEEENERAQDWINWLDEVRMAF